MVRRVLWRACLVALLAAAVALSEPLDGVGWQRAHVGRVTHAALAGHRAYVTTLQGVVACLSLRTGTTGAYSLGVPYTASCGSSRTHAPPEWRVVLDEGDAIDESVFTSKSIVTLSDRGRLLRAWSTAVRAASVRPGLAGQTLSDGCLSARPGWRSAVGRGAVQQRWRFPPA